MCTDLLQIVFLQLHRNTELAWAADVMMAEAMQIYILITKDNKLFSFSKEIENTFLSSLIETLKKVWEKSKKLWKHSHAACVSRAFDISKRIGVKYIYMYEDMIDYCSFIHNLCSWKMKAWKNSGLNGIQTHDLCSSAVQCSSNWALKVWPTESWSQ